MNTADAAPGLPALRSLHTDDEVLALAEPAPSAGGGACPARKHWQIVLLLLTSAVEFCGGPAALFARGVMPKRQRRAAFEFMRAIEIMLRRILMILAARDVRPLAPLAPERMSAVIADNPRANTHTAAPVPEERPIYFAVTPPAPHQPAPPTPRPLSRAPSSGGAAYDIPEKSTTTPAYNLARRLEAAIRVYKDPDAYVLRLRRRLAASERRAAVLYTRILMTPAGTWIDLLAAAMAEACGDAYDAIKILCERPPPIVAA